MSRKRTVPNCDDQLLNPTCRECAENLGFIPRSDGVVTANLLECWICGEKKSIVPSRHYKRVGDE